MWSPQRTIIRVEFILLVFVNKFDVLKSGKRKRGRSPGYTHGDNDLLWIGINKLECTTQTLIQREGCYIFTI